MKAADPNALSVESNQLYSSLPIDFFSRPSELVAPQLIGCLLIKRIRNQKLLWGIIVETEAYSQSEESCHGYKKRTIYNETLFDQPGHLYVYRTYGKYYCVNIVTHKCNWASGVLIRSISMPNEDERIASGPGLLANRFGINRSHDKLLISVENGIWLSPKPSAVNMEPIIQTTRIGISKAKDLPWRWYLKNSRSISKRMKGDPKPLSTSAWKPNLNFGK